MTEQGETVRVVYPGRLNDGRGADLRDAVIDTELGRFRGDIEVHVRSSDWLAHGHHLDPAYNRVILHIVFRQDGPTATQLQNGLRVPTMALAGYMEKPSPNQGLPCRARGHPDQVAACLDEAGDERFQERVSRFQSEIGQGEIDQALYTAIMAALGYARNKAPCLELAQRVPISQLMALAVPASSEETLVRRQAALLGTAGLLPFSYLGKGAWPRKLIAAWADLGMSPAMSRRDWELFKVRPGNLPPRRLAGVSVLLGRFEGRLLDGLIGEVKETPVARPGRLREALITPAAGFWTEYLDFDVPVTGAAPALVGPSRADEIVVNVLLPFAAVLSDPDLADKAIYLYRGYPRLPANSIERHMIPQLGIETRVISSARRQQGLLHIYHTRCAQGLCDACGLASIASGKLMPD